MRLRSHTPPSANGRPRRDAAGTTYRVMRRPERPRKGSCGGQAGAAWCSAGRQTARRCTARNAFRQVSNGQSNARGPGVTLRAAPAGSRRQPPARLTQHFELRPEEGAGPTAAAQRPYLEEEPLPLPAGTGRPAETARPYPSDSASMVTASALSAAASAISVNELHGARAHARARQFSARGSSGRSARLRPSAISASPRSPRGHRQTRRFRKFRLCRCRVRRPTPATSAGAAKRGGGRDRTGIGITPVQH